MSVGTYDQGHVTSCVRSKSTRPVNLYVAPYGSAQTKPKSVMGGRPIVLVTGGAGFIGTNLARRCSDRFELVAFDNFAVGHRRDAEASGFVRVVDGDIRDADALADACLGVSGIVHLAAQTGVPKSLVDPRGDFDLNVVGTFEVLEAARTADVSTVVLASSAAPLGAASPPASESIAPRPLSPYGASKLSLEAYGSAYAASFGLDSYTLRFSNVYGPWSYLKGSVVALWMKQLLRGDKIRINGDGTQTRDFVHVDDICDAVVASLDRAGAPGLYQLGTGVETQVADLARHMVGLFGVSFEDAVEFGPPLAGDVSRSFCDVAKARRELGYDPQRRVPEGLISTKAWFEENADRLPD